jgi:hypothetical protein
MSPTDFLDHADDIAECCKFAFGEHNEKVIYEPLAGGSYTIVGIFDNQFEQLDPDTEQVIAANQPVIGVKLADLPSAPVKGDKVQIRGIWYRVYDSQEDGLAMSALFLHKVECV